MFPRLRHHRVVARHDEQGQVKPGRPGEHVPNEPLVPGDVDEADTHPLMFERGEAQVDRDPALLLGREPVGIDAGQGPDQRRLAVVDMPGGAKDQVSHVLADSPGPDPTRRVSASPEYTPHDTADRPVPEASRAPRHVVPPRSPTPSQNGERKTNQTVKHPNNSDF